MTPEEVWQVEPLLRRVIAARVRDPSVVDDLVQDALEHLLLARGRLLPEMMIPYGVVTARNLAVSHGRRTARHAARQPLLLDFDTPEQPDAALLRDEERAALSAAIDRLPEVERASLVAHHVHGTPVADLIVGGPSAATMRVRLARSRAKLRVEYLLSMQNVTLPTTDCHPTLLVLAGGDRGRRQAGGTGRHLLSCATCASLSEPLIERRRGTAVLVPLVAWRWLIETAKAHPVTTGAATAGVAAVVGGGALLAGTISPHHRPVTTPPPSTARSAPKIARPTTSPSSPVSSTVPVTGGPTVPNLTVGGHPVAGGDQSLGAFVGQSVVAQAVTVESVVTHNGFWVGSGPADRLWVELTGPLRPFQVSTGDHVSFTAPLAANSPSYAAATGVDAAGGAAQLDAQGAHVALPTGSVTVSP